VHAGSFTLSASWSLHEPHPRKQTACVEMASPATDFTDPAAHERIDGA
jgi:hypothetical protein